MVHSSQLPKFLVGAIVLTAAVASADERFDWSDADDAMLRAELEKGTYGTVTSALVLHRGETVFEYYADGFDPASLHDTRSVTKTVTGMAVGLAIDAGLFGADDPVAPWFADIDPFAHPDPRKRGITAEDLLTMSGPLECDDWNEFSRGNEERMYIVEDWPSFFWDLPIRGYPAWAPRTRSAPYDRAFSYCTAGVQVLGEVVERASGMPYTAFVEEHLFLPLEIDMVIGPRNGQGQAHMAGGLRLTTRDLAKLGELQRNNGTHAGEQVLSRAWTRMSVTPHTLIPDTPHEYGYLWYLPTYEVDGTSHPAAAMSGNGGNRVLVVDDFALTAVITKTDYNTNDMHSRTDAFIEEEIIARLSTE